MRLWRITQQKHALDRLGTGAAQFGGRWNPIGRPAIYCGTSIALCALEKFVHMGAGLLPPLVLVALDLPDTGNIFVPTLSDLPAGWDDIPVSSSAQTFGAAWLTRGAELCMQVPSIIVAEEANMVLNPLHPDFAQVTISILRPFSFDKRMYKQAV